MNKNLYEVNKSIAEVLENAIDEETGEILDEELFGSLGALELEKEQIIEDICLEIKNTSAYAEALKAEKQAIASKQSMAERRVESLKNYVTKALDGEKLKTSKVSVSYRKIKSVEFLGDIASLPEDCVKVEESVKKKELKAHLDAGEVIPGAKIVERTNTIIK